MKITLKSCSLLATVVLSIAAAHAQEGAQVGRSVRLEESRQKGVATLTGGTTKELQNLIQEYQYNGIGQESQLAALAKLSASLGKLTDASVSASAENMPWVVTHLSAARELQNLSEIRKELLNASTGQDKIIKHLNELIAQMQKEFGQVGIKGDLKDIIQEQAKLKATTEKLGDQTLGKKAENLTPEQKADLDKVAQQQNALEQNLQAALDNLKQQAKDLAATDPAQAKAVEDAVKDVEKQSVQDKMQQASDNVADNKMAQAESQQQQVLDALNKAQKQLDQAQDNPVAKLENDLNKLSDAIQQQQDLLDKTNALDQNSQQQDFNQLQKDQADLQGQLAQIDSPVQKAEQAQQNAIQQQKQAEQAQKQADQQNTPQAQQQAQQAQQAADQAEQQAQQAAQEAGAPADVQQAQQEAAQAQQAADQAQQQGQGDKAEAAQQAAVAAMEKALAGLKAADAQQDMQQAQQDLGQMAQKPAAGDMQKALDAMKSQQQAMQQELAQMTGQQPGQPGQQPPPPGQQPALQVVQDRSMNKDPKGEPQLGASLKYGEQKTQAGVNGWQVGLAPQEREVLSGAGKDKFPARYEQQLALYYQNLAAGNPQTK